jgi:pimeloyl-ACP methyl ester carboxylesterase
MSVPKPSSSVFAWNPLARLGPPRPLDALLRSTRYHFNPAHPQLFRPTITRCQAQVLAEGRGAAHQLASVRHEPRAGDRPTIVLGGFVPDSTEQVFLLRGWLQRHGAVYYLNYSRRGFSLDLLCAQLDDLVEEISAGRGRRPILLGVSFGAGLVIEWLRRRRAEGRAPSLGGTVLVSPVACTADIVDPTQPKPTTLVGRALQPYVLPHGRVDATVIERSRTIFAKMFEAGAQNQETLRGLMSAAELKHLHSSVMASIREIDFAGASQRVRTLDQFDSPRLWQQPGDGPLSAAPAMILYAEKEGAVIAENSPSRAMFASGLTGLFPRGECRVVRGGATPVQHASLIFHAAQFLPHFTQFYRELKSSRFRLAA